MRCDSCGRRRPLWWALRKWAVVGGFAGYYDFCSRPCELAHIGASEATARVVRSVFALNLEAGLLSQVPAIRRAARRASETMS